jgi:hypothetical protein
MNIKRACVSMLFLFGWFATKDSSKESFFKSPKEFELSEDKSVEEKKEVIDREYQHPIENRKPSRMIFMKQPLGDHRLNKHHRETCARKHNQNDNHLPRRLDMPAILKSLYPLGCRHVYGVI